MIATIYTIEIRCYEEKYRHGYTEKELVDCSFLVGENKDELVEKAKELMEDKECWYADNPYFTYKIDRKVLTDLKYEEDNKDYSIPILEIQYYPKYYNK